MNLPNSKGPRVPNQRESEFDNDDTRRNLRGDSIALWGIGIYSAINCAWYVWALAGGGFPIFDTAGFVGLLLPAAAMINLVAFQVSSASRRFSVAANVACIIVVGAWFLAVWNLVAAASASV